MYFKEWPRLQCQLPQDGPMPFMHLPSIMHNKHLFVDSMHILQRNNWKYSCTQLVTTPRIGSCQLSFFALGKQLVGMLTMLPELYVPQVITSFTPSPLVGTSSSCHPEIESSTTWYTYFKVRIQSTKKKKDSNKTLKALMQIHSFMLIVQDYIGILDRTQIDVSSLHKNYLTFVVERA